MTIENLLTGAAAAILAAWLLRFARRRLHLSRSGKAPQEGTPLSQLGVNARLRDFYRLAVMMEEDGMALYLRLSSQAKDPAVQKLCTSLAAEEAVHRHRFQSQLDRWQAMPPNPAEWPAFLESARKSGLFQDVPGEGATEEEMARFAIRSEARAAEFYRHFEKSFPDSWRSAKMAELVEEELSHERKLRAAYPNL